MTEHLETRLEIKSWDEQPYRELDQTGKFTRADVELSASAGGLEAEAFFESLMCYPGDGTASFVSLMHIAGRIGDRAGSFTLQGSGTYDGTTARSELTVIPNSGTGELTGISGTAISSSTHADYPYMPLSLDYDLP